jgi:O-methyltransferase involved in polyketide biosynthesis
MTNTNRAFCVEIQTEEGTEYRVYRRAVDECLDTIIATFVDRNDAVVFTMKKNEATMLSEPDSPIQDSYSTSIYRKKSQAINAMQWNGDNTKELMAWLKDVGARTEIYSDGRMDRLNISAPHGVVAALPGDWIIVSSDGHTYPCKNNIFYATYERAQINRSRWSE